MALAILIPASPVLARDLTQGERKAIDEELKKDAPVFADLGPERQYAILLDEALSLYARDADIPGADPGELQPEQRQDAINMVVAVLANQEPRPIVDPPSPPRPRPAPAPRPVHIIVRPAPAPKPVHIVVGPSPPVVTPVVIQPFSHVVYPASYVTTPISYVPVVPVALPGRRPTFCRY
jgi:hypothetical protein